MAKATPELVCTISCNWSWDPVKGVLTSHSWGKICSEKNLTRTLSLPSFLRRIRIAKKDQLGSHCISLIFRRGLGDQVSMWVLFLFCFASVDNRVCPAKLEDLYVKPEHRNLGVGKAFFRKLGEIALERVCFFWSPWTERDKYSIAYPRIALGWTGEYWR